MSFTLLDGGMGQELMRRWDRPPTRLWSADVLAERADLVADAHADFLDAGADVITVASYSVTPSRLERAGRGDAFMSLQAAALDAAASARAARNPAARIAGCLPPLPGSYRPEERRFEAEADREYARLVEAQADAVDLFLCETLPSIEEIRPAVSAAAASGKPVWAAATVSETDGGRLRSGAPLEEAADAAREAGADMMLINCSPPEAVSRAVEILHARSQPFGAYANGFTTTEPYRGDATVAALEVREDLDADGYAAFARDWLAAGASLIGGCCEVGPQHIRALDALRVAAA